MSPRPRSSSSITSLSCWSAGTSFWKFRTACSIRSLVSAVDMRCGILSLAMDYQQIRYEQDGPVTVITIDRPERMNAIGPVAAAELVDAWTRFRDDDAALVAVLTGAGEDAFCAGGDLKAAFAGELVVPVTPEERAAHARGERPGHPRPDALDRPHEADDRRRQRRRLRGRPGVGVLDRPVHRRRARDVRRHLPALEHRPRRRRHAAAAAHRRLPHRDGADHHRPRDRRARGAADRARQRGRPARHVPRAGARAGARDRGAAPARDPDRQGGGGRRLRAPARRGAAARGGLLRPAARRRRRWPRACAASTSATIPTGSPAPRRRRPGLARPRATVDAAD